VNIKTKSFFGVGEKVSVKCGGLGGG